jgi:hypothetical protein
MNKGSCAFALGASGIPREGGSDWRCSDAGDWSNGDGKPSLRGLVDSRHLPHALVKKLAGAGDRPGFFVYHAVMEIARIPAC